jgi:hypothetical protein
MSGSNMKIKLKSVIPGFQGQILLLLLIMGCASIAIMGSVPLIGDEHNYNRGAKAIAHFAWNIFNPEVRAGIDLQGRLVEYGWRMPGMAVIISPLYFVVGDDAPLQVVRAFVLIQNLVLLYFICIQLAKITSEHAARVFLITCLFVPYYVCFLSTLWSELIALHLAILFLFYLDKHMIQRKDIAVDIAAYAIAALCYIRALYPSFALLVVVTWFLNLPKEKAKLPGHTLKAARMSIVLCLIILGLIFPWSVYVSELYGPSFLITSTRMGSLVETTDKAYVQEAMKVTGEHIEWRAADAFIKLRANENQIPFRKQLEEDKAHYVPQLTVSDWLSGSRRSLYNYLGIAPARNSFLNRFFNSRCDKSDCIDDDLASWIKKTNTISWSVILALGTLLFVLPMKASPKNSYFMPFFWKAMLFSLTVVPLFGSAHSRYYAQYVPLFGIGIGYLFSKNIYLWKRSTEQSYQNNLVGIGQLFAIGFAILILAVLVVV